MGTGSRRARFGRASAPRGGASNVNGSGAPAQRGRLATLLTLLTLAGASMAFFAAPASAAQGLFDFFGHTGSAAGQFAPGLEAGPQPEVGLPENFTPGPTGIAVNDTSGDIYVADRINNRIQQFDSDYSLLRAWGIDVIPAGAAGTGTLTSGSTEVTSVVTTAKAFIPGQVVSGTGIPAGTTIRQVVTGVGAASKLVLSDKATASGSGVAIAAAAGSGNLAQNERQSIAIKATAGSYQLQFKTSSPTAETETGALAFDATAATVQSALEGLANIGAGNVEVTGPAGGPYLVEFKGTRFADTDVARLASAGSTLTGPGNIRIVTEQDGAGRFEKCTTATTCQAGSASGFGGGMNGPAGVTVHQGNQNVYVTDVGNARVNQYDADGDFVRSWGANVVEAGPGNKPEVQSIKVAATDGSFVLSFGGQSTAAIPYNAAPAAVETALNGLSTIGGAFGSVAVSGGPGDATGSTPYQVTFGGALANADVESIQINSNGLGVAAGTVLSCTAGPSTATLSYQWLSNGAEIAGATSSTYTVAAGDAGKPIQCRTKAAGEGATVKTSALAVASPVPVINPPGPGTPSVTVTTPAGGKPTPGNTLTCAPGAWTPGAPNAPTFTYRWLRNGDPIGGATASTYVLQAADVVTAVQCEVTGTNAGGSTVAVSGFLAVRSEPPVNTGVPATAPTITGTGAVGQVLTCGIGTWTPASPATSFQWLRNGQEIAGATANTYTVLAGDENTAIQCRVIATAGGSAAAAASANKLIGTPSPTPPVRPAAVINIPGVGAKIVGRLYTCASGTWTPASPPSSFSFQWLRNGVAIPGATSASYTIAAADLDKLVQCQVTATSTQGASVAISPSNIAAASSNIVVVNPPVASSELEAPSAVTTTRVGALAEICEAGSDVCRAGSNASVAGTFSATSERSRVAVAPAGPYAGDVFVADPGNLRIQIFAPNGAFVATFGKGVLASGTETVGKNVCIAALGNVCKTGENVGAQNTYGFGTTGGSVSESRPSSFTVGPDGAVYVPGINGRYLQKYSPDLSGEQDFAPYLCSPSSSESIKACSEVAVDPSTGDVYVAYGVLGEREICLSLGCFTETFTKERAIARLDAAGSEPPVERLFEGAGIKLINGIAIDGSSGEERSGRIYLTTNTPEQRVDVVGEPTAPSFDFAPIQPGDVHLREVDVHATINPNGDKIDTTYQFETLIQGGVWTPYPVPAGNVGNGVAPVAVDETVPGLRPNTKYRIRLAVNKGGRLLSPEQTFTTAASGPDVETGEARWSGPPASGPSLTFFGTVDNNNQPVSFYFEYGTDASYGKRVPIFETGTRGAGQKPFLARQTVAGLDPNASYHYRVVARTASGTSFGLDREIGPAQPGGRFAELVSPVEKGVGKVGDGIQPFVPQADMQAAVSGDAMAYYFQYGVPGATSGGEILALGRRASSGWSSEQFAPGATSPPLSSGGSHGFNGGSQGDVNWISPELDCSFVMSRGKVNDEVPQADFENDIWHLFRRDSAGAFKMITPTPLNGNVGGDEYKVRGATADCNRVVFQTGYRLLSGLPVEDKLHIYEWEAAGGPDGTLRLVDRLPDGSIPPNGAASPGTQGGPAPINSVSRPDADRAFFTATSNAGGDSGKQAVFVREDHAVTTDISQSQTGVPNNADSVFHMASRDGSHAFFVAIAGLAPNSTTTTGKSLYDYDLDTDVLTDLSPNTIPDNTAGAAVRGVLGASNDGSHVYFAARGQLLAGKGKTYAENNSSGDANVYLSEDGALSFVGTLSGFDQNANKHFYPFVTNTEGGVGTPAEWTSKTTPDGEFLLFNSSLNQTSYDGDGAPQLYRYSAEADEVVCVSCRPGGPSPNGKDENLVYVAGNQAADTHQQRAISADGSRAFYTLWLREDLASGGERIVFKPYEWHDGELTLLAPEGRVIDSSADGSDVFVLTANPLVPQDQDVAPDIYDLRIDGGFAYSPVEPCDPLTEGSCQGTPPTPPAAGADPASAGFDGPGNPPPVATKPKCKKGQVLRKGKCVKKKRGHKKAHKKGKAGKRTAGHNRGGSK